MLEVSLEGTTLILTLNDARRRNPLSGKLAARLLSELDAVVNRNDVRAVVITGAGGNFCSGGDFDDMPERDLAQWRDHFEGLMRFVRRIVTYPKPTVAAVEGWAAGAGLSLACCCDMVVAAEDARFAYAFDKIGVLPDLGLSYTLPVRVGVTRARQIMIWGENLDAAAAKADGIVDRIAPKGRALDEAVRLATTAAAGAPLPIAHMKPFLAKDMERALAFEVATAPVLFRTADHAEGKAAFFEKRAPVFTGA
ncbi:enoyl-CoA hydratase/isomerase family protein [Mesorhizobium sp. ANAO-SY3R2]|uniref:enoyl-CoA hydratase/isomerase family protein n=1 Tax=Mesorhizobium sp. ANAO-SY3R2 TaxID=3166644 RepID=UPI00366AEE9A